MKKVYIILLYFLSIISANAQRNEVFNERIASLQVMAGDDWQHMPVITLGGRVPINIDFDDLTHEYHRYVYRLEHCEADWTVSEEIFTSDYIDGFNDGEPIEDLEESLNTNILYTHYHLQIPNTRTRIKLSGNYKLTVYDENNDDEPMFAAYFMVVEPIVGVSLSVTTNTDLTINSEHQQVSMEIGYSRLNVTNPAQQIKTVVMQNGRWDDARINVAPQYTMPDGLRWDHCRGYIFEAGNEYRKFEMLDMNHTTMGLEHIGWDGSDYHAYPWTAEPRLNYVYDEDANGAFVIRNSDNYEINRTSDYLITHFRLKSEPLDGDVYVNGWWTNDILLPQYRMTYNEEQHLYEALLFLKQGYYSYQYLLQRPDGTITHVPSEGSFYQTENTYQAFVYYRGIGERTDRLVGYQHLNK